MLQTSVLGVVFVGLGLFSASSAQATTNFAARQARVHRASMAARPLGPFEGLLLGGGTPPVSDGVIENATEGTFTQLIDHHHKKVGVFQQRYYINKTQSQSANSPVVFLICGEYTCDTSQLIDGLAEGGVDEYVKELHATLVILEHRYYGKSQPFADISTEHLKYLSTGQAIEDMAAFHRFIEKQYGLTGKWISIGGSYAGILSSFFRVSHPSLVAGALASSAPVHVQIDFPEYDKHASDALTQACGDQIRTDVAYFESALTNPTVMAQLRAQYQMPATVSDTDMLDAIEGLPEGAIQYGQKDQLCAAIQVPDSLTGWFDFANTSGDVGPGAVGDLSNITDFDDGGRQWTYQTCTEYGYFQTAYPDPQHSLLSARQTLAYQLEPCRKYFGITGMPNVDRVLKDYTNRIFRKGNFFQRGTSNILFTNAQDDPWTELGITPDDSQGKLPKDVEAFEYSVYAHHGDLKPTTTDIPASVLAAKNLFRSLVPDWLSAK